jgi:hypothetical protein
MSPSTQALVQAFADAVRREQSAREAAATAMTDARAAAQLQLDLLGQLRAAGIRLNVAVRLVGSALGEAIPLEGRQRLAARYRKRLQRQCTGDLKGRGPPRRERRTHPRPAPPARATRGSGPS